MSKLKQLETFVAVAARGGLTAAAKAEGVAPAIIGRRLDALEERLGVKLPLRATETNDSICFNRSMAADYTPIGHQSIRTGGVDNVRHRHESLSLAVVNAGLGS